MSAALERFRALGILIALSGVLLLNVCERPAFAGCQVEPCFSASASPFSPTGTDLLSTTVQAALVELANRTGNIGKGTTGTLAGTEAFANIISTAAITLTMPPTAELVDGMEFNFSHAAAGVLTLAPNSGQTFTGFTGNIAFAQPLEITSVINLRWIAASTTWFLAAPPAPTVYNASGIYARGQSVFDSATPAKICLSRAADNTGNALTSATHWICVGDASTPEAYLSLSDNTTNDVSTTKHGFAPKAPNDTTKFFRGDATWAVPPASSPDYRITGQVSQSSLAASTVTSTGLLSNITGNGTGTATVVDDAGRYISYTSAASADADAGWDTSGSNSHTEEGLSAILEMRVYVVDVTAIEIFAGWYQQSATLNQPCATTESCIGFAFDDSADEAFWQCISNDGSTSITKTDSTVALTTNTFYNLRIDWTTASTPLFYINGTQVCASHTTDLPADTQDLKLRVAAETEDGTAKTFGVAWAFARSY